MPLPLPSTLQNWSISDHIYLPLGSFVEKKNHRSARAVSLVREGEKFVRLMQGKVHIVDASSPRS